MIASLAFAVASMSAIIALRYLASSGLFAWLTGKLHPGHYAGLDPQIHREIAWSLASSVIYGIPAGLALWAWQSRGLTRIYLETEAFPLWYPPVSLAIYLVAHDSWFYWTHRWMHRPALFRLAHRVHHDSRPPTAWTAMSFHPLEAATGAVVIPALVFLVPIHWGVLALVLAIMTVMGVTNHMGWEIFPRRVVHSRLGKWVISASHHERHHEQYSCNFGLYFRFWDRVCGTDRGLTERFA